MKFTVLIPVYHAENSSYFKQALDSIYSNSVKATEVLVVCDGPLNDDLEAVLDHFSKFDNLSILRLDKNYGIVTALNYGLRKAKNDIIIRCDSDDINHPDRFEKLCLELANGSDVVGSFIQEINADGKIINRKVMPSNHEEILVRMKFRNPVNHMSVGFNRKMALSVGGYPNVAFKEDYALWVSLLMKGLKFYNIPEFLVSARVDDQFHTRRKNFSAVLSEVSLYRHMQKNNFLGVFSASFFCVSRIIALLLPISVLRLFYKFLLRKRP